MLFALTDVAVLLPWYYHCPAATAKLSYLVTSAVVAVPCYLVTNALLSCGECPAEMPCRPVTEALLCCSCVGCINWGGVCTCLCPLPATQFSCLPG